MDRRSLLRAGLAGLFAASPGTRAQTPSKNARIGLLANPNRDLALPSTEAFLRGMRELGWVEGKNLTVEYRWADGDMDRHPALASELVRARVDVIVTAGPPAVRALSQATKTIPIVVAIMPDPVGLGVAASLAHPGGNVTGLANLFEELTPKQLQIFTEAIPGAKRIALLNDHSMGDSILLATQTAARTLGLAAEVLQANDPGHLDAAMSSARRNRDDGVIVLPSPFFNRYRARIAQLAEKNALPTFSEAKEYVRDGGLLSYGPDFPQMYYRAATYVDRILKGEKPGDLPIERPTKFELAINLKTAHSLGITIPQPLLVRADEVIK